MNYKAFIVAFSLSAPGLVACGNDNKTPPAPPTLGEQIDRMGRPAVNTALTDPFNFYNGGGRKDQIQNAYNTQNDTSRWATDYAAEIAFNLGIFDSLDGTCGNQAGAGATATAGRYNTLAGVLAYDLLFLNTDSGTCTTYLGVELAALGVANQDCGGRTPSESVIDPTYSLLAVGAYSGVTNGITSDATSPANNTTFPFLGAPQP
ncbi:MAG TPA: hypothetical protein VH877_25280 [Polyangia bacterium]|nr:hypothetical protein [Polyangia bacterium]